jgi:glutathione S-transferase
MPLALPKLHALHVSPWSERAEWALDHHRVEYERVEHFPILGERRLRRLVGPNKARATVPVLVTEDGVLSESWEIARYADRVGTGATLIPPEQEGEIRRWTALADDAMQSGRVLVMAAMLSSPEALDEAAPPAVPAWARPLVRPFARRITLAFVRKYDLDLAALQERTQLLEAALAALREGLRAGAGYLLASFSYADIALATMLQGVSPVADRFRALGPATRGVWTREPLAREFADVIAWRDQLYERHRPAAVRRGRH